MSCSLRFEKDDRRKVVYLSHGGKNLYKLEQFASWLQGYSLGAITEISATQTKTLQGQTQEGQYGAVTLYAIVKMKTADEGKPFWVILPAPDVSIFETNQQVTPDFGIACAEKYSILAGTTLLFTEGALCGSSV
jgi:hypothetical protein